MPKTATIDTPTLDEVQEFGEPAGPVGPRNEVMETMEEMEIASPATWRAAMDRIGEHEKRRLKFDDTRHICFGFPRPDKGSPRGTPVGYLEDTNNSNLQFRARITGPPLSPMLVNSGLQAYEWWFQVAISFHVPDEDEEGNLREDIDRYEITHDLESKTEDGKRIFTTVQGMRTVKRSGVAASYIQDLIRRTARKFVRIWVPEMCKEVGVQPPRIRSQDGQLLAQPGGKDGAHAHETFIVLYY